MKPVHAGDHFFLSADSLRSPPDPPRDSAAAKDFSLCPRATVQSAVDAADFRAGRRCTSLFLPLFLLFLVAGTVAAALLTSGRAPAADGAPRAALFVFEGFPATIFERLIHNERLPHVARMLREQRGVRAICNTLEDARCARAVPVEDARSGEAFVSAGAGIASVLTGVAPRRHRVREDSWASYRAMAGNANNFPSVALRVTRAGKRVAAFGAAHLFDSLRADTGQCSEPGVLDAECERAEKNEAEQQQKKEEYADGDYSMLHCLNRRSCNVQKRFLLLNGNKPGDEERRFTAQLTELFGGLAATNEEGEEEMNQRNGRNHASDGNTAASMDSSLVIFHFNALARHASDPSLPDFTYDPDSLEYAAQAFLIDSLVGQALAFLRNRALTAKENWLVVGTSDHGGVGKAFGSFGDLDEVVPFFVATYTNNRRGYARLRPLQHPVTHMDAAPTILRWLGIAPYDTIEADPSGLNNTAAKRNTSAAERLLDGRPQGICSSGKQPQDCAVIE